MKSLVYLKPEKKVPLPKDRIMEKCTIFEDCRTVDSTAKHTQETEIKFYSYYIYIIILLHSHFRLYNPPYKFICLSIVSITSSSFKTSTHVNIETPSFKTLGCPSASEGHPKTVSRTENICSKNQMLS